MAMVKRHTMGTTGMLVVAGAIALLGCDFLNSGEEPAGSTTRDTPPLVTDRKSVV